jgi:protein-disulfide isomerase
MTEQPPHPQPEDGPRPATDATGAAAEDRPLDSVLPRPQPRRRNPYVVPFTVAATAGIVAVAMALGPHLGPGAGSAAPTVTVTKTVGADESTVDGGVATATGSQPEAINVARRQAGDPLAMGRVDAPVVMVEYSDFSCPYCASFAMNTEPELVAKYVDTGVLRIEWRDFPYLTDQSGVAAIVARAAAKQGKFWEVHHELFTRMHAAGFDKLDTNVLADITSAAGLDAARFTRDFGDTTTAGAVSTDLGEGQNIGVNGTPSFVINGRLVVGSQPLQTFEQVIEQAAAAAR